MPSPTLAALGLCALLPPQLQASEPGPAIPLPPALREALDNLCLEAARALENTDLDEKGPRDGGRLPFLLSQARALAPSAGRLPLEDPLKALAAATLGALEVATGREEEGFRRYGSAAKALAVHWRATKAAKGPSSLALLPDLRHLATLQGLAGLRSAPWRDEALRIRCAASRGADSALEKDLAEAVEDHYGPWLTPVELEPMLEFCGLLARQWQRASDDRAFTRHVAAVGLKDSAGLVWRLAARKGSEGLRADLQTLLTRLDAATLLENGSWTLAMLKVAEAIHATPLQGEAEKVLTRLETLLIKAGPARLGLRRRIAEVRKDAVAEETLLAEELDQEKDSVALRGLLMEGAGLLARTPCDALQKAGTLKILNLARTPAARDSTFQGLFQAWVQVLRGAGDLPSAGELAQLIPESEPPPSQDVPEPTDGAPESTEGPGKPGLHEEVDLALIFARKADDPQEAILRLEAILPKLEGAPKARMEAECLMTLLWMQGMEGQEKALETTYQRLFRLLEEGRDVGAEPKEAPILFLAHLWRAQRLDEVITQLRRWETLLLRDAPDQWAEKFANRTHPFERMARFQGLLRAAGI